MYYQPWKETLRGKRYNHFNNFWIPLWKLFWAEPTALDGESGKQKKADKLLPVFHGTLCWEKKVSTSACCRWIYLTRFDLTAIQHLLLVQLQIRKVMHAVPGWHTGTKGSALSPTHSLRGLEPRHELCLTNLSYGHRTEGEARQVPGWRELCKPCFCIRTTRWEGPRMFSILCANPSETEAHTGKWKVFPPSNRVICRGADWRRLGQKWGAELEPGEALSVKLLEEPH